jgi:hypothetical protein
MALSIPDTYNVLPEAREGDVSSQRFTWPILDAEGRPLGAYLAGTVLETVSVRHDSPSIRGGGLPRKPNTILRVARVTSVTELRRGDGLEPRQTDPIIADMGHTSSVNYWQISRIGRDPYGALTSNSFDVMDACAPIIEDSAMESRVQAALMAATVEPPYC